MNKREQVRRKVRNEKLSEAKLVKINAHWDSIIAMVEKDGETGLTRTEATILKIKALEVIHNPNDWTSEEIEIARDIVKAIGR